MEFEGFPDYLEAKLGIVDGEKVPSEEIYYMKWFQECLELTGRLGGGVIVSIEGLGIVKDGLAEYGKSAIDALLLDDCSQFEDKDLRKLSLILKKQVVQDSNAGSTSHFEVEFDGKTFKIDSKIFANMGSRKANVTFDYCSTVEIQPHSTEEEEEILLPLIKLKDRQYICVSEIFPCLAIIKNGISMMYDEPVTAPKHLVISANPNAKGIDCVCSAFISFHKSLLFEGELSEIPSPPGLILRDVHEMISMLIFEVDRDEYDECDTVGELLESEHAVARMMYPFHSVRKEKMISGFNKERFGFFSFFPLKPGKVYVLTLSGLLRRAFSETEEPTDPAELVEISFVAHRDQELEVFNFMDTENDSENESFGDDDFNPYIQEEIYD